MSYNIDGSAIQEIKELVQAVAELVDELKAHAAERFPVLYGQSK